LLQITITCGGGWLWYCMAGGKMRGKMEVGRLVLRKPLALRAIGCPDK
jgi:hypothetical protein